MAKQKDLYLKFKVEIVIALLAGQKVSIRGRPELYAQKK